MIEPWMKTDALMSILMRRGDTAEHAFEQVERISYLTQDGNMSELAAIESVLGYVPHGERERLDHPTSQKDAHV